MEEADPSMRSFTTSIVVVHPIAPKVLCIRHPSLGTWMFPGGRIEPGEPPHVAALREITEEVGLGVSLADLSDLPRWSHDGNSRLPHPIAIIEERVPDGHSPDRFYVDIVYVGVALNACFSLRGEVREAGWFDRRALFQLQTSFPIQEMAAQVFDRMRELRGCIADLGYGRPG
jgi:8-oxo-dGTP pyrophosphatase MutT (NUDIX family)